MVHHRSVIPLAIREVRAGAGSTTPVPVAETEEVQELT